MANSRGGSDAEWIAACSSKELGKLPKAVTVNGRSLVIWRVAAGYPVALDDICPHQGSALSLGAVVGDAIRCPFHGWIVASDGWCDRAGSGVPAHAVREESETIFVKLGVK
jgi:phenylpropionate dioxygenase-like ring-hydroxylating dioxygenase large terminal subunit